MSPCEFDLSLNNAVINMNDPAMYTTLLVSYLDFFDAPGEIPFMYKKAGHRVVIFCCETSWLKSNRFHDEWIDASTDKQAFALALIKLIKEKGRAHCADRAGLRRRSPAAPTSGRWRW